MYFERYLSLTEFSLLQKSFEVLLFTSFLTTPYQYPTDSELVLLSFLLYYNDISSMIYICNTSKNYRIPVLGAKFGIKPFIKDKTLVD